MIVQYEDFKKIAVIKTSELLRDLNVIDDMKLIVTMRYDPGNRMPNVRKVSFALPGCLEPNVHHYSHLHQ